MENLYNFDRTVKLFAYLLFVPDQVNDLTTLNYKKSYIACSADTILKSKGSQVYDVYVTGSSVVDAKGDILPVTRGDIIRYNHLCGESCWAISVIICNYLITPFDYYTFFVEWFCISELLIAIYLKLDKSTEHNFKYNQY